MDEIAINKIHSSLLHMKVEELTFHGGMPFFNFGKCKLFIACSWRLVDGGDIVAGNVFSAKEEEEVRTTILNLLQGKSILDVSVQPPFHDLKIEFSEGTLLEIFANSGRYESWNYIGSEHKVDMIIAGPGSSWSAF
jgi:hypothetical protein